MEVGVKEEGEMEVGMKEEGEMEVGVRRREIEVGVRRREMDGNARCDHARLAREPGQPHLGHQLQPATT